MKIISDSKGLTDNVGEPEIPTYAFNYAIDRNKEYNISYNVNIQQELEISIFNLNGQRIRTLTNDYHYPGRYSIQFSEQNLPNGIYIIKLQSRKEIHTKKITFIK